MEEQNNTTPKRKTRNNRGQKLHRDQFSTWEGHPLTAQEAHFIDRYVETGNGKQSYMESYENANPKSAAQMAQRVLNKAYVISEINHRLEQARDESIADATEIMQYFTSVMRGEISDQFGLEASLSERTKAAQELAKRQIDIPNKLQGNEVPEVKITLDWKQYGEE